jgi:hypothetical protein
MLYQSERGNFNIALAGDCMPTRRLSVFREDRYLRLRDIFCEADVGFAHLEATVHTFLEGHLNLSEGTYITTEPSLLEDIKWFGINVVSCAGSHSFDYGEEGILRTMQHLDKAGIIHAGTGRHLREARSPAFLTLRTDVSDWSPQRPTCLSGQLLESRDLTRPDDREQVPCATQQPTPWIHRE